MIGIVDYGIGNINAFSRVFKLLGMPHTFLTCPHDFDDRISKIILPGVGAFDHAMKTLNKSGLRDKLNEYVLDHEVPTLGVCVGFQMFCDRSEEGSGRGLNWIAGEVIKIKEKALEDFMPLPHMGWNKVDVLKPNDLTIGVDAAAGFYFLHSYQVATEENHVVARSHYGETITSIYQHKNIYGIQPHPEKSHSNGIKLLENFGKL